MPVIDLHTHFIPSFVIEEAASGGCMGVVEEDGWFVHPEGFRYPVGPEAHDPATILAAADERGIDIVALSLIPPFFCYQHPVEENVAFARRANDALAQLTRDHDRIEGLATLPLQAGDGAAAELERAVTDLGLRGAHIGTASAHDVPLDNGELESMFETASRLGVPLMLHSTYVGLKPGLEDFYLTNTVGNLLDTTVSSARLIHAGVFDRHENLKVALVHAGGYLPWQIGRFDHAYDVRQEPRVSLSRPPSEYLDRFWMDTITHSDESLEFLASRIGTGRIYLGTDIPFDMGTTAPLERIKRVGIDPEEIGATAAELINLS